MYLASLRPPILACLISLFPFFLLHAADNQWIQTWQYDSSSKEVLKTQSEPWKIVNDSIVSPSHGYQFTYPDHYSALKNFTVEATLNSLQGGPNAAAGIHLGAHVGAPLDGWNFFYTPASGEFRYEYRSTVTTKVGAIKIQKLDFPVHMKLNIDSNTAAWKLSVNGTEIFNLPSKNLPVLWETGLCSLDGRAEFTEFRVSAGDIWKPIIVVGDSITHHCGWSELVSQKSNVAIGNAGMASDTTSGVLKRLDSDAILLRPKFVVIFIGTNDSKAETAISNYPKIIDQLIKHGIQPILCTALPRQKLPRIDKINTFLRKIAKKDNLPIVDWHDALQSEPGELNPKYGNGRVHPNKLGAELMAEIFLQNKNVLKAIDTIKAQSGGI